MNLFAVHDRLTGASAPCNFVLSNHSPGRPGNWIDAVDNLGYLSDRDLENFKGF